VPEYEWQPTGEKDFHCRAIGQKNFILRYQGIESTKPVSIAIFGISKFWVWFDFGPWFAKEL
jgi:hypothetical protein